MSDTIIYNISMTLINLTGIIIAIYFYDGFFVRKHNTVFMNALVLFGIIFLSTVSSLMFEEIDISTIIVFVFYFLILIYGYQGKLHIKTIASIFILVFSLVTEMLAAIILVLIFGFHLAEARENLVFFAIGAIISKLLLVIVIRIILKIATRNVSTISTRSWILIISIPITSIYLVINSAYKYILDDIFSINAVIICSGILCINLITFHLFDSIIKQTDENNQYRIRQNNLLIQQEQYINIITSYEKVKSIRHDMINHLISLNGYLNSEKYQEAKNYLDNLYENLSDSTTKIISGNVVIDAILNNKKELISMKDILFKMDIVVCNQIMIDDMDLCILLGNALDNAIEACERIKDANNKMINLKVRYKDGNLLLNLENTYDVNSIKMKSGKYVSTKRKHRSTDCGLGMDNMKRIVAKYSGNLKIEANEDFFRLCVLVPICSKVVA